jgi:hypothetical protein
MYRSAFDRLQWTPRAAGLAMPAKIRRYDAGWAFQGYRSGRTLQKVLRRRAGWVARRRLVAHSHATTVACLLYVPSEAAFRGVS